MPPATRVFANRYELGEAIGHGGMADVYLAHDRLLDRRVAVKVLLPQFATDPTNVERFRREAQAAAGLNHPHIVAVYDWGEEDDTSFIVMEYVPGQTLREILQAYGRLGPTDAARIAAEIADALSFAHAHGVVHRDVKPGNVLITPQGQVKVTDFGIAARRRASRSPRPARCSAPPPTSRPSRRRASRSTVAPTCTRSASCSTRCSPASRRSPRAARCRSRTSTCARRRRRRRRSCPTSRARWTASCSPRWRRTSTQRYPSAQDLRADLLRFERGRPLVGATTAMVAPASVRVAAPVAAAPPSPPRPRPRRDASAAGGARPSPSASRSRCSSASSCSSSPTPTSATRARPPPRSTSRASPASATARPRPASRPRDSPWPATTSTNPSRRPTSSLGQDPEGGRKIPKGGLITLKVSSPTIAMPNVVGQNKAQATADPRGTQPHAELRRGGQRPAPGHRAQQRSRGRRPGGQAAPGRAAHGDGRGRARAAGPGARRDHAGSGRGRGHARCGRVPGDPGRACPSDTVPGRQGRSAPIPPPARRCRRAPR